MQDHFAGYAFQSFAMGIFKIARFNYGLKGVEYYFNEISGSESTCADWLNKHLLSCRVHINLQLGEYKEVKAMLFTALFEL